MSALAVVRLSDHRLKRLAETANRAHRDGVRAAIIAGQALIEAKKLLPHGSWLPWLRKHCDFSESTAQAYMQAARTPDAAGDSLRQVLRALKNPTRFAYCSGNERWFTPATIVEAARSTLGRIDLDPASEEQANRIVRARRFFSVRDDGLRQPWRGRVFMNPPYSATKIPQFIERLVLHVRNGSVPEAIVVVNSETEVRWFQNLSSVASAICFPARRVRFWKPGKTSGGPPMGTSLVYIGRRPKKFGRAFAKFGHCWFA